MRVFLPNIYIGTYVYACTVPFLIANAWGPHFFHLKGVRMCVRVYVQCCLSSCNGHGPYVPHFFSPLVGISINAAVHLSSFVSFNFRMLTLVAQVGILFFRFTVASSSSSLSLSLSSPLSLSPSL